MKNRLFLLILVLSILIISGCKSTPAVPSLDDFEEKPLPPGNIDTNLEPGTKIAGGNVNTNEIGGNNLAVITVQKSTSPVSNDGSFTTLVSSEGAQLIMVVDGNNKLRAYAISLPQSSDNIIFDASSTAKGSIFFTPGILSIDPQEAENRLRIIVDLSCYPELVSYLKGKLKTKDLVEINTNQEYVSLLTNCINEYPK